MTSSHGQRQCIVAASDVWQHDRGVQSLADGALAVGPDPQRSSRMEPAPSWKNLGSACSSHIFGKPTQD
jgi:hypothetical protein